ncbi:hypothetical protein ACHAQA_008650 [Verticillium albo-atrum]
MVSFFGLKLGGDKKKKNEKSTNGGDPQWKKVDRNALGKGEFFGTTLNKQDLHLDENTPIPRPGTATSNRSLRRPKLPYMHGSGSMVDLAAGAGASYHATQPSNSGASVRHYGSETNLRMRWNNGSSTSLAQPKTPAAANGRPGTAGSTRGTGWVNPLDVHFCRDGSSGSSPANGKTSQQQQRPSTSSGASAPTPPIASTAPQIPKSPLGQFEFNLSPLDVSKSATLQPTRPLQRAETTPMQLQPASVDAELSPIKLTKSHSPPRSYPSPPLSLRGPEKLERPIVNPITQERSSSLQRDGAQPKRNADARPEVVDSPPSPVSSHEDQEAESWDRPVIRDVTAKRDTLTHHPARRQSVSMDVEELSKIDFGFNFGLDKQPSVSGNGSPTESHEPPPRSARRPPPPVEIRDLRSHGPPRGPPPQGPPPQVRGPMQGPPRPRQQAGPYEGLGNGPPRGQPPTQRMPDARPRPRADPFESTPRTAPPLASSLDPAARSPVEPIHPSKGPQDFNVPPRRPQPSPQPASGFDTDRSYGISPANRRPAPPRLNAPAPPLRDEGAPLSPSYRFPKFDEGNTFSAPRQAPSPLGAGPQMQMESPREPPPGASNWPLGEGGADASKSQAPAAGPGFRERTPPPQWAEDRRKVERARTPPLEGGVGMGTRPDFGLRAPTGIADEFQVGFI